MGAHRSVAVAAGASGFAALCYEVSWLGQVRLLTGHTAEALAGTVALFLAGLAVGAAVAARWLQRKPGRTVMRRRYVGCELGAALSGAVVLVAMQGLGAASGALSGAELWVVVALLLAVPTVLLGAALPLLVAVVDGAATPFPRLYAWNTAGAAVGALAAFADMIGTVGNCSGTGVLLMTGIIIRMYEEMGKQKAMEMHPMLRQFFGK